MSLFDEPTAEGTSKLIPKGVSTAGAEGLKIFGAGAWKLFRLLRFKRLLWIGAILAVVAILNRGLVATVETGTFQVRQMIVTGELSAKLEPGMWLKLFSNIVTWPKAETFFFTDSEVSGEEIDRAIEVRFNDGSLCDVSGTLRVVLPISEQQAIDVMTKYGYADYTDLEQKLVLPVVRNALRLTANLMSARESYSEQRSDFVFWTWDQIQDGVYETEEETRKVVDPVSGQEVTKSFKIIKQDAMGNPVHQRHPLEGLGITLTNFEVKLFDYTEKVRAQIGTQQSALMAVATARAKAQQAEQEALMAEAEGKANVARARYEEEEKKIRAIVAGQQRLEVGQLDRQAAAEKKQEQILLGQGEAERKRLVLQADGALKQKLDSYVRTQGLWASAYSKRQVPSLIMGGGGAGDTDTGSTDFAQMMQLMVARQMGLDLSVPKGATRGTQ